MFPKRRLHLTALLSFMAMFSASSSIEFGDSVERAPKSSPSPKDVVCSANMFQSGPNKLLPVFAQVTLRDDAVFSVYYHSGTTGQHLLTTDVVHMLVNGVVVDELTDAQQFFEGRLEAMGDFSDMGVNITADVFVSDASGGLIAATRVTHPIEASPVETTAFLEHLAKTLPLSREIEDRWDLFIANMVPQLSQFPAAQAVIEDEKKQRDGMPLAPHITPEGGVFDGFVQLILTQGDDVNAGEVEADHGPMTIQYEIIPLKCAPSLQGGAGGGGNDGSICSGEPVSTLEPFRTWNSTGWLQYDTLILWTKPGVFVIRAMTVSPMTDVRGERKSDIVTSSAITVTSFDIASRRRQRQLEREQHHNNDNDNDNNNEGEGDRSGVQSGVELVMTTFMRNPGKEDGTVPGFRDLDDTHMVLFAGSLRRSGFLGDIVIGVLEESEYIDDVSEELGLVQMRIDHLILDVVKREGIDNHFMWRYYFFKVMLENGWDRYMEGRVLITDFRDVVFQRDPFGAVHGVDDVHLATAAAFRSDHRGAGGSSGSSGVAPTAVLSEGLHVSAESTGFDTATFGNDTFLGQVNGQWIHECYGAKALEQLEHDRAAISCSGVTLGSAAAVHTYLRTITDEYIRLRRDTTPFCYAKHGVDQGIHNYLIHSGALGVVNTCTCNQGQAATTNGGLITFVPKPLRAQTSVHHSASSLEGGRDETRHQDRPVHLWHNDIGPVKTVGTSVTNIDRLGRVYNIDGGIPAILHQYDRIPELKALQRQFYPLFAETRSVQQEKEMFKLRPKK